MFNVKTLKKCIVRLDKDFFLFESNYLCLQPQHNKHHLLI